MQKQYHTVNTKGAKLQEYNTTVWVQRPHEPLPHFHTVPWLSSCLLACVTQSDQSLSSNSEESSESLYSTAMRLDRIVATSFPTGSRLASCSRCSCTFFSWIPRNIMWPWEANPFGSSRWRKNKLIYWTCLDIWGVKIMGTKSTVGNRFKNKTIYSTGQWQNSYQMI